MKKAVCILFLLPLISVAQKPVPRFENDTLYTTSGYKIYKGMTLQFGEGTGRNKKFRFINIKNDVSKNSLLNTTVFVRNLKNFGISSLDNAYIEIEGYINFKDGSKAYIDLHMAFDKAIENSLNLPSELIVPDEFRNIKKTVVNDELGKLYKLYKQGAINKTEYEARKAKILNN